MLYKKNSPSEKVSRKLPKVLKRHLKKEQDFMHHHLSLFHIFLLIDIYSILLTVVHSIFAVKLSKTSRFKVLQVIITSFLMAVFLTHQVIRSFLRTS